MPIAAGSHLTARAPSACARSSAGTQSARYGCTEATHSNASGCARAVSRAILGTDIQDYGNPLRLRRALDAGVRVVVAHCASMGEDRDLDRGAHGPVVESFALFARLMDEPRYAPLLYGDLSAMTQVRRAAGALSRVLERADWHARLLNGSDYPLPGMMPLFSTQYLVTLGLLEPAAAPVLAELRRYNPLLYDFVLKRSLRRGAASLGARVFETRRFFEGGV